MANHFETQKNGLNIMWQNLSRFSAAAKQIYFDQLNMSGFLANFFAYIG